MTLKIGKNEYEIIVANDFKTRLVGLMGKKDIDFGMLFPNCNSVHTFFMNEEIDIVGLDINHEVIYKYECVAKNQIIRIKNPHNKPSILELPNNASKKIKIGQILLFKDKDVI